MVKNLMMGSYLCIFVMTDFFICGAKRSCDIASGCDSDEPRVWDWLGVVTSVYIFEQGRTAHASALGGNIHLKIPLYLKQEQTTVSTE